MSLAVQRAPLIAALEQLGPHDHFCSIYESPEEHYAVAVPFIRIGLDRGEKCIYIADDGTIGDVREAMQSEGIDVDRATASNALVLATKEDAYLEHGSFRPDWMFTFWKEATELAMSQGFSALRATGETEWVLRGGRGLERWMEYESRLTHTLSESNCSALCQYNRRLFPPDLILDVIRTHPMVVYGSTVCRNLYYVPPDEFLGMNQTAREVERLLTNIRERERVEETLREQLSERRRVEEELREQARLLDLTHDPVFTRGMDDQITYWNRGAEELYGWTREEALHKVSHQLIQTIFPAPLAGINAELLRTGRWEGELVNTKRDGTQVVVASRWSLQRDELGGPAAILETNNDITKSKRAEEAQLRLGAIVASSDDAIISKTLAGVITSWNAGAQRIFGYRAEEAVGLPINILIPPDRLDEESQIIERLRRGQSVHHFETVRIRKDGRKIHVSLAISPIKDAAGQVIGVSKIARDITERKRAEAELRESERRYRYIFQSTGVSIWEEDFSQVKMAIDDLKAGGVQDFRQYLAAHPEFVSQAISMVKILDVNEATVELFAAHDKHELLASLDKVFTPETREVFAGELIALAEGRTWFQSQASLKTLKGDRISVVCTITFPTESDKLNSVLVSIMDTTEQKRAEEALHKAQEELAHVTRVMTIGELVASIAHEVNQPLGAIVTNGHACVHLLSRQAPDLDKSREVVGRMIRDGMRASEVIKRIRDLLHKTQVEKARLNINETIQEVMALVGSEVLRNKVELKAELAADLPAVLGDRIQLQQVILNLILNAKDAMSGAQTNPRELEISSGKNSVGAVVVTVRDTGHGLEAKDVERIFDPFFTTKPEGMGLGLSISRTIIEAHGGTLWATQNEDKGATIQFLLPPANGRGL